MFTDATYAREFGYVPIEDDVERTNCTQRGESHDACGQHTCCGSPRFRGHVSGCVREGTRRWNMARDCAGRCDACTDAFMRAWDAEHEDDDDVYDVGDVDTYTEALQI